MSNGQARSPPAGARAGSSPSHNSASYQYQNSTPGQRPLAPSPMPIHQTPATSVLPDAGRLPSPVFNRPMMSPTQGNMDVGPVAGVPQKSAQSPQRLPNGIQDSVNSPKSQAQATPRPTSQHQLQHAQQTPISRTPNYPLSGLSPKKQQTPGPVPPPGSNTHNLSSMSPPYLPADQMRTSTDNPSTNMGAPFPGEQRTVSGTPVLPPVENLRPSPEQMRHMSSTEPVPTPSKQPQPQPSSPVQQQPNIQFQLAAEQSHNAHVFAASASQTASGSGRESGLVKENGAAKKNATAGTHMRKDMDHQAEEVSRPESSSHPNVRDVAMQDVQ